MQDLHQVSCYEWCAAPETWVLSILSAGYTFPGGFLHIFSHIGSISASCQDPRLSLPFFGHNDDGCFPLAIAPLLQPEEPAFQRPPICLPELV